jgi:dynein heavy chain
MACRSIGISRGYGLEMFREDIKKFFLEAGVEGKPVAWLFTDSQIVEEGFLEDINNILNTGDIPNLWENDEVNRISSDMIPWCKKMNIPATRDNCLGLFVANEVEEESQWSPSTLSFTPLAPITRTSPVLQWSTA